MRPGKPAPDPHETWRKAEAAARRTVLEDLFAHQLHAHKLPLPAREHRFHATRLWRFDFAWPAFKIAVEVEGGTGEHARGRHMRTQGFQNDADKLNAAVELGWRVYRYTAMRIRSGCAVAEVRVALERAAWGKR